MEISVVIPVYNKEAYVKRCFRQLMAQDFDSFEVVAVDDGSTDRSGEICDKMAQQDQRIRIIHTENGGVTAARRRGMEESQGKYIMFVDSDDELLPGALRTMHQTIEESGADEVIATYYDQYGQRYDTGRRGFVEGEGIIHDCCGESSSVVNCWKVVSTPHPRFAMARISSCRSNVSSNDRKSISLPTPSISTIKAFPTTVNCNFPLSAFMTRRYARPWSRDGTSSSITTHNTS